jgi:uncharacterized protein (DUF1778 family)
MSATNPRHRRQRKPALKAERLEARISGEQKKLFQRAAAAQGRSLTDFVLASVHDAAVRTLQDHEMLKFSAADSTAFVTAMFEQAQPSARLKKAARRYRERTHT